MAVMSYLGRPKVAPTTWITILFTLSVVVKLGVIHWLKGLSYASDLSNTNYSYIGYDYPQEWPIERAPVLMAASHSVHFELEDPSGIAEWSAIVPGDGMIYLGEDKQPFMVSMMHQLRCLDILRGEIVRERVDESDGPSYLARHCLNYMKQMILCRGDIQLESVQNPSENDPIDKEGTYECRDWEAVYSEMKKNQEDYAQWLKQLA